MTTEPYTARHLGWDYTVQQHRQEIAAHHTIQGARRIGPGAHPIVTVRGKHGAYGRPATDDRPADRYPVTDPSTRLDMQMADEVIA